MKPDAVAAPVRLRHGRGVLPGAYGLARLVPGAVVVETGGGWLGRPVACVEVPLEAVLDIRYVRGRTGDRLEIVLGGPALPAVSAGRPLVMSVRRRDRHAAEAFARALMESVAAEAWV